MEIVYMLVVAVLVGASVYGFGLLEIIGVGAVVAGAISFLGLFFFWYIGDPIVLKNGIVYTLHGYFYNSAEGRLCILVTVPGWIQPYRCNLNNFDISGSFPPEQWPEKFMVAHDGKKYHIIPILTGTSNIIHCRGI